MSDLYELKKEYLILKDNKDSIEYPLLCIELLEYIKVLSHAEIYHLMKEVTIYLPKHELNEGQEEMLEYYKEKLKEHKYYKKDSE